MYSTSPVKKIVGRFRIESTIEDHPKEGFKEPIDPKISILYFTLLQSFYYIDEHLGDLGDE